jgi:hypothetical protein
MTTQNVDSYWQRVTKVGAVRLPPDGHSHDLYLQIHTEREEYLRDEDTDLGLGLSQQRGERIYVHVKFFILQPRIIVSFALSDEQDEVVKGLSSESDMMTSGDVIGEVVESRLEGMERRIIGSAQAWFYTTDRALVLWECDIFNSFFDAQSDDPVNDRALKIAWKAFEQLLGREFPDAKEIITPAWEPKYEAARWQEFLRAEGYQERANNPRALFKSNF